MGGSSGVLLQIMASSAAVCASKCEGDVGAVWADAFVAAVGALRTYGKADRGYGTMLDPFLAVCDAITSGEQRLSVLASAAGAAAEATSTMPKLAGRASYSTHLQPVADPGSIAIAAIFKGIANA